MLTIVKLQCPVLGIWGISKGNVLCTFLANSLQPPFSLHLYSFVQEWLWLKLLRILWMRLWAGSNICWWLHPAVRLLNLCRNHSRNCVTTCVKISHVTYISVCRVFMQNISVWKVQKEILWVMRFSQLCFGLWLYISEYNSSIQEKLVAWYRLICWGVKKIHW